MDIYLVLALVVPPILILWRPRGKAALGVILIGIMTSAIVFWVLLIMSAQQGTETMRATLEARISAGEAIGKDEWLRDGTGYNAAVLLIGWLPGLLYAAALVILRLVWQKIRREESVADSST